MVEPVTWGRRSRAPLVSAAVALNLISGGVLMLAGLRVAKASRTLGQGC
jgi:hypothetical protein